MTLTEKTSIILKYSDQILELIHNQLRNDENTLTQSDMQGRSEAIIMCALDEFEKMNGSV